MTQSENMTLDCETYIHKISLVTEIFRGKWTLQILCAMRTEPLRLRRLTRLLPGASKKAVRAGLRDLELAKIIVRRDLSGTVLHVEYDFEHDMKHIICNILRQLAQWGAIIDGKHLKP